MIAAGEDRILLPFGEKAYNIAFRQPEQDKRYNILEGSVRSAKTWALIPKIISLCKYQVKGWRVFTGVSKGTIYQNVLSDLFTIIGPDNYGYNRMSGELDLFGTKWLVIGARDEGSEKAIRGLTVGICVADELTLLSQTFVKMIFNRMSVEGARFYATTNPDTPFHYVKTDLLDNPILKESGDLFTEHFQLSDNPNLPADYPAQLSRMYPPGSLYWQRFVMGLWVTGEGAIFKDVWSEELLYDDSPWTMSDGKPGTVSAINLRDPRSIAERYVPVDCGVDHPQVYLDIIDDGKELWCDREYVWDSHETHRQKTDRQYREDLQAFLAQTSGAQVIIPPECASFEAELMQAGIWYCVADNEVLDGIKNVSTLMALKRIHFHRKNCPRTIAGLQTYCWDPKAALRGVEQPLKVKDDECDALRYGVQTKIPAWRLAA